MALDQRKRQKNIEKRNAKQKARKKALLVQHRDELTHRLQRAAGFPILHCCINRDVWSTGMGSLVLSRGVPGGDIVYSLFLIDTLCLGVKDVTLGVTSWSNYQDRFVHDYFKRLSMINLTPEAARKFIEGAVEFARKVGLAPHDDYQKGMLLFGDVDASACTEEFVYGNKGQHMFIEGPNSSPAQTAQILALLSKHPANGNPDLSAETASSAPPLIGTDENEVDDDDFGAGLDDDFDDDLD